MRKKIKIVSMILSLFIIIFAFCFPSLCTKPQGWTPDPPFNLDMTEAEIREMVRKRTNEKFYNDIKSGKILNFNVYTVYNFNEKPKYFLVDIEFTKKQYCYTNYYSILPYLVEIRSSTRPIYDITYPSRFRYNHPGAIESYYMHIFGYVSNGKSLYQIAIDYPLHVEDYTNFGPSLWHIKGILYQRMYIGGNNRYCYKGDDGKIYCWYFGDFCLKHKELSEEEIEDFKVTYNHVFAREY